jgi:anti-sigma factor RsiW
MDCKAAVRMITPYIQGELSDSETEEFLEHIRHCSKCRNELETNYIIMEGLRLLDSGSDDFDVKGTMDRAIRNSYKRLREIRLFRIVKYSVNTLIGLSLLVSLLLELRIYMYG